MAGARLAFGGLLCSPSRELFRHRIGEHLGERNVERRAATDPERFEAARVEMTITRARRRFLAYRLGHETSVKAQRAGNPRGHLNFVIGSAPDHCAIPQIASPCAWRSSMPPMTTATSGV